MYGPRSACLNLAVARRGPHGPLRRRAARPRARVDALHIRTPDRRLSRRETDRIRARDRAGASGRTRDGACKPWPTSGRGGTVYLMTTKERLHQVVEAMREQEAVDALDILASRTRDALARRLDAAPLDDEPLTDEERESLRDARADKAAGRLVSMDDLRRELG